MKIHSLLFAVAIAAAGAARADPTAGDVTSGARVPPSKIGVSLGLGGGASGFTATEASDATSTGGVWEVRSTIGTRQFLAGEIAYVGSRLPITMSGVSGPSAVEAPHLFSHGVEGAVRVQSPNVIGEWLIEPFAFGGFGWSHIGVDGVVPAGSQLATSDDILVAPFGGGIAFAWNGLVLEGRFTYRATFNEDLLKKADNSTASLANWSVGGLVGYEF